LRRRKIIEKKELGLRNGKHEKGMIIVRGDKSECVGMATV